MAFVLFANASTATGAQLDLNFGTLGAMALTPCGVTGTNNLSLTPLAAAPQVSTYVNYQAFAGIAAADNTGTVSAGVGGLNSLPVYKDSPTGPVLLTGGEIQQGNLITLTYDSSLNPSGGFHLQTGINSSSGTFLPLTGGTLTNTLYGTSLSLTGDVAAQDAVFTGGVTGVSVAAVQIAASATLSGATVTIGGTTPIKGVISTTVAAVVFPTILPNSSADQASPFVGLNPNDTVMLGLPSLASVGVSYNGFCSTAGTVTLRAFNVTASTVSGVTLASVRYTAIQF